MKCSSNKIKQLFVLFAIFIFSTTSLTGCGKKYDMNKPLSISSTVNLPIVRPSGLADENVVIPYDAYVYDDSEFDYETGLLINETKNTLVTAVNPHKRFYPASMTKTMTAIIVMEAIERGDISLTDTVLVKSPIEFDEDNVVKLGLEPGDYITVDELLHGLLIASFNDCAIVLARYVADTVGNFVSLMNEKAAELGATNTHFMNPHGLHNSKHYTTPYDLYLIFKEFSTKDYLVEIESAPTYVMTLYRNDEKKEFEISSTNSFLSNAFDIPTGYSIKGWKTGTTEKAGKCIILQFVKDETGEEYICLVSKASDYDTLYKSVEEMLREIY